MWKIGTGIPGDDAGLRVGVFNALGFPLSQIFGRRYVGVYKTQKYLRGHGDLVTGKYVNTPSKPYNDPSNPHS